MKAYIILLLLLQIFLSCNSQNRFGQSVFLQKMADKNVLLENGFKPDIHHIKLLSDSASKIISDDNLLHKKVYDTSLLYYFNHDRLISYDISFSIDKTDTSSIFNLLASLGFTRELGGDNVSSIFTNTSRRIRYEFISGPKYFRFTSWPRGKPKNMNFSPIDSLAGPGAKRKTRG